MENNVGLSGRKKAVALFKWSLRKNLPFSIAYWILLFLSFPMIEIFAMIVCGTQQNLGMESYIKDMKEVCEYLPAIFFVAFAIIFSIIMAIMSFSYMHNKRSVDLFGSYPISRRTLFFVRYFSTLVLCIVPMIIIGSVGAILGLSDVALIESFKVIGILTVTIIGNVSFIAMISLCCGTVADVLISYVVISAIYPICVLIGVLFPQSVIPGLAVSEIPSTVLTFLSPAASFYTCKFGSGSGLGIAWWICLSVVLMAASFVLCKQRKAESAQNAFAFSIVEIIIKFFTCFATGFGVGYMCSFLGDDSCKAQYIWFVVGTVIAVMTANLLLHLVFHRGLSKFKSSLMECGVVFVCIMAFLLITTSGGLGYLQRVPDKEDVQKVNIIQGYTQSFVIDGKDVLASYTDDANIISDVCEVHKLITNSLDKHHGFLPIKSRYGGSEQESISIKYVLKNGKTISRKYDGYYIARNTKDIMKKMSDITSTKYYSQVKHPFYIIPYKYITDMQISKYVVNGDADEEEIYGDDYAVKAGQVTDEVDYLSKPENNELINSFVEALKKDVEANGMYIPKNNEKIWGISVTYRISSNDGYDDGGYASGLIYIPEAYTNTMKVLEDKGYLNDAYNFLSECETYTYNEKGKYLSGKKIYFTLPKGWDKNKEVQCVAVGDDETMLTEIDNTLTKCKKVSDTVWMYEMPDDDKYTQLYKEENDEDFVTKGVVFYQIGKKDMNISGLITLPEKYDGQQVTLGKQLEKEYENFFSNMYEYNWTKFNK